MQVIPVHLCCTHGLLGDWIDLVEIVTIDHEVLPPEPAVQVWQRGEEVVRQRLVFDEQVVQAIGDRIDFQLKQHRVVPGVNPSV